MVYARSDIDYVTELLDIRDNYITATPRQRLSIIRQRLDDHHFGPNRLVTSVSAVEALARCLVMHDKAANEAQLKASYRKNKDRPPKSLVQEFLRSRGVTDAAQFFEEDTWRLFGYAVDYRNLLTHECTYLGQDKFPELIAACEEVLNRLARLAKVRERAALPFARADLHRHGTSAAQLKR